VARAATTADAFNAVAEPRRRQILDVLAGGGERPVKDVVAQLGLPQSQVSKHLRVLREVGAVEVRDDDMALYRLNGLALKPIHDWVKTYERSWSERFDQLDVVLEQLKKE
jgi:DNA-binding transcriptional ArsR family regulator